MTLDLSRAYNLAALDEPLAQGGYYLVLTNSNFVFGQDWICFIHAAAPEETISFSPFEVIQPGVAFVTGKNPANSVRIRLQKAGATVYAAKENGVMTLYSDGQKITVQP